MRKLINIPLAVFVVLISAANLPAQPGIAERPRNLSGYWYFVLDRTDSGINQQWFNVQLRNLIKLPGVLQSQYQGDEISTSTPWVLSLYDRFWYLREEYKEYTQKDVKVPFLSQPPRHYLGVVWYQREIVIPANWAARRVVLTLERPHWETTVWIDTRRIGSDRSLVTPHVYDLGTVSPGRHRLTIRVDNRMLMPYRPDAHSVSDSVGASWNGITGRIELTSTSRVWIDDVQAFPNLPQKSMLIKVRIGNQTGRSGEGTLTAIWPDVGIVPVTWDEQGGSAEFEVPVRDDAARWDEFNPKLQPLRLWLKGVGVDEYYDLKVGLRDFRAEGNEFRLNDRPIIFRGTHNGGDFPLTGYPSTDIVYWRKLFDTCRRWGLNHMRFHSWCPPEAAFEAADELGFYLQVEPGMWNEISPGTAMEAMLYEETNRMIKAFGNHPSFMLLSASNEPRGNWKEALSKWVEYYRKVDPRRLYTSASGHVEREVPNITEGTDYLVIQRIGHNLLRRESGWFGSDYKPSLAGINVPVIAHEVGQWAAYPDLGLIKKFTGYMRPGNYEIFRDSMKSHELLEKNRGFEQASGAFQVAAYKEEIEANLRTPGLGGFQLLDLHDYLGQGTAFVGLLNAFWEEKSYVTANEFKEFCNATVPLARLRQRVFTSAEPFDVDVEIAHFGAQPIENGKGVWRITGPQTDLHGEWDPRTIPIGKNIPLGKVSADLSKRPAPAEYKLTVTVAPAEFFGMDGRIGSRPGVIRGVTYFENAWNFWIYSSSNLENPTGNVSPECPPSRSTEILITDSWDEAEKSLANGGKVLFVARYADLDWNNPPLDTVPIFWNRLMFPAWGRMLGLWIDRKPSESKSVMLNGFPTSSHFDWQWAQIVPNVRAVNLDRLPPELEPLVWAIDDWNRNYKLGVLFECVIGDGKLLVSAFDVTKSAESHPVARQLRYSLLNYMKSECFQPQVSVYPERMRSLFFDTRIMRKLGATARINGEPADNVIDGDPNTFVLVGNSGGQVRDEVDITITFPAPVAISGLVLMPRQNQREHEGEIRQYAVRVSDNGSEWRDLVSGELPSTFAPKHIEFTSTITTRYLKFFALSGFGADMKTSLAELAVQYAGPKLSEKRTIEYNPNRNSTPARTRQ